MFYEDNYASRKPDREYTNESDGQHFVGYDDEETGTTAGYDDDGNLDCITDTPHDDFGW